MAGLKFLFQPRIGFLFIVLCFIYSLHGKPPFREYALPLKRERWHAQRAEEEGDLPRGLRQRLGMTIVLSTSLRTKWSNLRQGLPPFVASRHFPHFSGDIYPAIKGGAAVWSFVLQSSGLPRSLRSLAMTLNKTRHSGKTDFIILRQNKSRLRNLKDFFKNLVKQLT